MDEHSGGGRNEHSSGGGVDEHSVGGGGDEHSGGGGDGDEHSGGDIGPTSPRSNAMPPGCWQGSRWSAFFRSLV